MGTNSMGWIGVDLDGTPAEYNGYKGPEHIGEPVKLMLERVNRWLQMGQEVRIFTARVSHDGTVTRRKEAEDARAAIQKWCLKHIGLVLEVTNLKDYQMLELWDDRAVQVEPNTGVIIGRTTRNL